MLWIAAGICHAGVVVDTAPALNYNFNEFTVGELITISNGPFLSGTQTLAIQDASNTFEVGNKVNITVNDAVGGDTFIVNFSIIPTGLTSLTVTGGPGADLFTVTPPPFALPITINGGGNPQPAPGNVLEVLLAGTTGASLSDTATPNGYQGAWTFTSNGPVNFTGIQTIPEPGVLPMVACGLAGLLMARMRFQRH